jgi:hypothetical protein
MALKIDHFHFIKNLLGFFMSFCHRKRVYDKIPQRDKLAVIQNIRSIEGVGRGKGDKFVVENKKTNPITFLCPMDTQAKIREIVGKCGGIIRACLNF